MLSTIKSVFAFSALSASLLLTPGVATADEAKPEAPAFEIPEEPKGITCVFMPRPRDYTIIDRTHLVLEASRNDVALITLRRYCRGLATTFTLGLDRDGSRLCALDKIITDSDRCSIHSVEEVDSVEHAQAIVEARAEKNEKDDE